MSMSPPSVQLRVPTPEDAAAWHRVFDHPEVVEVHGGASQALAHDEEFTTWQRHRAERRACCFFTLLDESAEVRCFAGAQPWPYGWGPAGDIEIGWRLGRAFWGRGYATLAAKATLERPRAAGVRQVVAMVAAGKERSIAVTRRLGRTAAETYPTPVSRTAGVCHR